MKINILRNSLKAITLVVGLVLVSFTSPVLSAATNKDCSACHEKHISTAAYNQSVHQALKCNACHVEDSSKHVLTKIGAEPTCVVNFLPMDCGKCHATIQNEYHASVHNSKRLPITCSKCHTDIHSIKSIKNDKIAAAQLCIQCHENESEYFNSAHYKALLKGSKDAPTCTDCHGNHTIQPVDNKSKGRVFNTKACLKCHGNEKMMTRNHVTTIAPETFFESYHGKNVRLGYPEKVAGCADCHSAHNILAASDKNSTVNPANKTNTCKQCHPEATEKFAKFLPHAEPNNRAKNPALYWVTLFMNLLMIGTFLFFWIHSILWSVRGVIEKRKARKAAAARGEIIVELPKQKVYRRFRLFHILLHIVVVSSFLALAITGLPLKFNDTTWGKTIMDALGGVHTAGLIHRIGAVITFGYFIVTLVLSGRFLFSKSKTKRTFAQRLFGPDSLFPNMKDLRDIRDMFRWFFFMGPKPSFDRWTYWEKFDFMAVFWGVAVIGTSGLMLWMPEFFGQFLPGWVFNMATIIHSDEALLAVGFIFTVHFFNTHFRAEKFPMDFVIFNGEISEEEMLHERSEQWKRYQEGEAPADFEVEKASSKTWNILLRLFGITALLTGITLVILIIIAFFG